MQMYEEEKEISYTKTPERKKVASTGLNVHTHKHPFVAGNIKVPCPVVESGHLESNPLQALGQLHGFFSRHAAVNASDDL